VKKDLYKRQEEIVKQDLDIYLLPYSKYLRLSLKLKIKIIGTELKMRMMMNSQNHILLV
jgi:hypothetical protein